MNVFDLLSDKLKQSVQKLGFSSPTPVQSEVIPKIINGENVLFQSDTGTGKTFAYLFPLITKLDALEAKGSLNSNVKIIIIAPTFELASQINAACKSVTDIKTALLIGGVPIKRQIELLKEKPQIVIGTASRIVELIHLKKLKVENLFAVVFDETDRLLKKEAISDTSDLRNLLSPSTQIIACSATINKQTKIFFADSKNIILPPENILKEKITHWAIFAENRDKIIVGVVGVLQFEVLEYRLKSEYNVEIKMDRLPFRYVRWIENNDVDVDKLNLTSDAKKVKDFKDRNILIFQNDWGINWALEHNKGLILSGVGKSDE